MAFNLLDDLLNPPSPSIADADAQSEQYGAYHPPRGPHRKRLAADIAASLAAAEPVDVGFQRRPMLGPADVGFVPRPDPLIGGGNNAALAAVGNANIGQRPGPSLKSRIFEGLQGAAAGIAAASPPSDTSFLPSLARSFSGTAESIDAGRDRDYQRQLQAQLLQRRDVMDQATLDREGAQTRYYDAQANRQAIPAAPLVTAWQREGYPDFATWRADQLRRAGGGVTPGQAAEDRQRAITNADRGRTQSIENNQRRMARPGVGPGSIPIPLTPAQIQANEGLNQTIDDSTAVLGRPVGAVPPRRYAPGGATGHPRPAGSVAGPAAAVPGDLTPADLRQAKADPAFAEWLRKQGYSVP